jgi:hypothetical protein
LKRCPRAFPFGQYIRAIVSLMMITGGASATSPVSKKRPAASGIPIAWKYSRVATRDSAHGSCPGGGAGRSARPKLSQE